MNERRANFVAGWDAACRYGPRSVTQGEDWCAGFDAAVSHNRQGDGAEHADGYVYGMQRLTMGHQRYQVEEDGEILWA